MAGLELLAALALVGANAYFVLSLISESEEEGLLDREEREFADRVFHVRRPAGRRTMVRRDRVRWVREDASTRQVTLRGPRGRSHQASGLRSGRQPGSID